MRYPLSLPPTTPGIYALNNRSTGQFYIGGTMDLRRRYVNWHNFAYTGRGRIQAHMTSLFSGTNIPDWDFVILLPLPGASRKTVQTEEAKVIEHAARTGRQGLVNIDLPVFKDAGAPLPRLGGTGVALQKTTVLNTDGRRMTYRQVATALGVGMKGLRSRLKQYRDRGINVLKLEDLKFLTDKYVSTKS